jgi:hypothetical protein
VQTWKVWLLLALAGLGLATFLVLLFAIVQQLTGWK